MIRIDLCINENEECAEIVPVPESNEYCDQMTCRVNNMFTSVNI